MEPITLYRRAIRSGRIEMMSEVVVRLSDIHGTDFLIESLLNRIELLVERDGTTLPERFESLLLYNKISPHGYGISWI